MSLTLAKVSSGSIDFFRGLLVTLVAKHTLLTQPQILKRAVSKSSVSTLLLNLHSSETPIILESNYFTFIKVCHFYFSMLFQIQWFKFWVVQSNLSKIIDQSQETFTIALVASYCLPCRKFISVRDYLVTLRAFWNQDLARENGFWKERMNLVPIFLFKPRTRSCFHHASFLLPSLVKTLFYLRHAPSAKSICCKDFD